MFEHLATDEIEHMGVIATVFESLTNNEPWMTYEEAVEKYGETPREKIIFPEVPEEAQEDFDDLKALEEALEFEKKAVRFYTNQAEQATDEKARTFYKNLIEIEESHVAIIQAELDSLPDGDRHLARFPGDIPGTLIWKEGDQSPALSRAFRCGRRPTIA